MQDRTITQAILPLLNTSTLRKTMNLVDRLWNQLVEEELKTRVTIYVWKGENASQKIKPLKYRVVLSQGHAAMETHVGGPHDRGYYISLWPGECYRHNENNHLLCQERVSHLHSRRDDDFAEDRPPDFEFHIYNLDVIYPINLILRKKLCFEHLKIVVYSSS